MTRALLMNKLMPIGKKLKNFFLTFIKKTIAMKKRANQFLEEDMDVLNILRLLVHSL